MKRKDAQEHSTAYKVAKEVSSWKHYGEFQRIFQRNSR